MSSYPVAGMEESEVDTTVGLLQERLIALIDLSLTLKHVHWNVVGPTFIGVHEMLDPQVDAVRLMVDATAERIATLGGEPQGTPGAVVGQRSWEDYDKNRAPVAEHLAALDTVYAGVTGDHRAARKVLADADPVSEDMIIEQLEQLEQFQWFVRAHLATSSGDLEARPLTH